MALQAAGPLRRPVLPEQLPVCAGGPPDQGVPTPVPGDGHADDAGPFHAAQHCRQAV